MIKNTISVNNIITHSHNNQNNNNYTIIKNSNTQ